MKKMVVLGLVTALFLSLFSVLPTAAASVTPLSIDFTDYKAGAALPSGYTVRAGSAQMGNGYLELSAGTVLTLPSTYQAEDFTMEVDFTIASANEPTRWVSFMYRTQGSANPTSYMQMCVRQGASAGNGVEIAYNGGNGWQYNSTASNASDISASQKYTAKIEADGNYIAQYINDVRINITDEALSTKSGGFALQTNGAVMRVYAIRLSDKRDLSGIFGNNAYVRSIYEPSTGLVGAPTVIQTVSSKAQLTALRNPVKPQGVWLPISVESDHKVILGEETQTLANALKACGTSVIPVIQVYDMASAKYVANVLRDTYYDVILASADKDVLRYFTDQRLDYTRRAYITHETDMKKVAQDALCAGAMICVLQDPTRANVEYLQKRFLSVTVRRTDSSADSVRVAAAINCGANGVVVADKNAAYNLYKKIDARTQTHIRRPFIVGHRGYPTVAPENSIEGMKEAFNAGADAVECDIWATKDGHVVINHNGNLGGYTTDNSATAAMSSLTRSQIKSYTLKPVGKYTNCKFAFLDEMFEVLKTYPDKMLVIELKTTDPNVVTLARKLAVDYNVLDRIVFISFHLSQITNCRKAFPEVGASWLGDGAYGSVMKGVETIYGNVQHTPASGSPGSNISANLVRALQHRGITTNHWTINSLPDADANAKKGATFITTDHSEFATQLPEKCVIKSAKDLWNLTPAAATVKPETVPTASSTAAGKTTTSNKTSTTGTATSATGASQSGTTSVGVQDDQTTTTDNVPGDTTTVDTPQGNTTTSVTEPSSGNTTKPSGDADTATTAPVDNANGQETGAIPAVAWWVLGACAVLAAVFVVIAVLAKRKKA